jgi:ATP-binding cassette subfamily C protein CydD
MIDRRLFALSSHIRPLLILQAALTVCTVALLITQWYALSVIIHASYIEHRPPGDLLPMLALLITAIALRAAVSGAQQTISRRGAVRIKHQLRERLIDHLLQQGPALTQQEKTGTLTATLTDGLEKINAYFARYLPRALHVAVIPLTLASYIISVDLLSGGILFFTGPLVPVFMYLIGSMAERRTQTQWTALSRMSAHFLDTLHGLATLKLFNRTAAREAEMTRVSNRYRITTMGVLKIAFLSGLVLELAASLSTAIVAVQIGIRLVEGHIPFQLGLFVLLLAPEFYLPFRQLGTEHHAAMEGRAAADDLFRLLETRPLPIQTTAPAAQPNAAVSSPADDAPTLRFDQLSFTYPHRDHPALQNITCTIPPRGITALVGPSGAGKSTLFQLLCRYRDPQSGHLYVNDTDLTQIDRTTWRQQLAWVPQQPALFAGTIADNLRMARPDASFDELTEAARQAEAHRFILDLPQGYDTPVGEQAWRLSGGQRQRLAIARAFLKNAPLLLLDEPAAHLDPESEERIAAAYERLSRDRTVLVIAHRLRTVYRANLILVLEHGRLIESGRHAELMQNQGLYARLLEGGATA